jgi:hypothetical protein
MAMAMAIAIGSGIGPAIEEGAVLGGCRGAKVFYLPSLPSSSMIATSPRALPR